MNNELLPKGRFDLCAYPRVFDATGTSLSACQCDAPVMPGCALCLNGHAPVTTFVVRSRLARRWRSEHAEQLRKADRR